MKVEIWEELQEEKPAPEVCSTTVLALAIQNSLQNVLRVDLRLSVLSTKKELKNILEVFSRSFTLTVVTVLMVLHMSKFRDSL